MSNTLIDHLSKMLMANVGPVEHCNMPSHCPVHGLKNWESVYNFLNKNNVFVPAGVPNVVSTEMNRFSAGLPFEGAPCPPGKVLSSKTHRCITRRKPRGKAAVPAAPCPPDKILNPATRRCVKRSGKIGKKLL